MAPKDLKHLFIRGLLDWEIFQRRHHYLKSAAEWTSRAIIGEEICKKLKEFQSGIIHCRDGPVPGRFVSSAPALLLAILLSKEQATRQNEAANPEKCYISEDHIKHLASTMCEEKFHLVHSEGEAFCPALWRLNVMCSRGLIKKRSVCKQPAYELLPPGLEIAVRLRAQQFQMSDKPELCGARSSEGADDPENLNPENDNIPREFLYSNDNGQDEGLVLRIDTQEWGGDRVGLSQLVELVERTGMRYRTEKLKCGDYAWIQRWGRQEFTLPFLVERKRADDLARSLRDGRYSNQRAKMLNWGEHFAAVGVERHLVYLIEGKPEQYAVRCVDGCGAVIKCGYPTVHQLKAKIKEIDEDSDFQLIETEDIHSTVEYLQLVYAELLDRLDKGEFNHLRHLEINPDAKPQSVDKTQQNNNQGDLKKVTRRKGSSDKNRELPHSSFKGLQEEDIVLLEQSDDGLPALPSLHQHARMLTSKAVSTITRPCSPVSKETQPDVVIEDSESQKDESQEMLNAPLEQYHTSPRSGKSGKQKPYPNQLHKEDSSESYHDLPSIDPIRGTVPVLRARNTTSSPNKIPGKLFKSELKTLESSSPVKSKASPMVKVKVGEENLGHKLNDSKKPDLDLTGRRKRQRTNSVAKEKRPDSDDDIMGLNFPGKKNSDCVVKSKLNHLTEIGLCVGQKPNRNITETKPGGVVLDINLNLSCQKDLAEFPHKVVKLISPNVEATETASLCETECLGLALNPSSRSERQVPHTAGSIGSEKFEQEKIDNMPKRLAVGSNRKTVSQGIHMKLPHTATSGRKPIHPVTRNCDVTALNKRRRLNFEASSDYGKFNVGEGWKSPPSIDNAPKDYCDVTIEEKELSVARATVSKPGLFKIDTSPGNENTCGGVSMEKNSTKEQEGYPSTSDEKISEEVAGEVGRLDKSSDSEDYTLATTGDKSTLESKTNERSDEDFCISLKNVKVKKDVCKTKDTFDVISSGIKRRLGGIDDGIWINTSSSEDEEFLSPAFKLPRLSVNPSTSGIETGIPHIESGSLRQKTGTSHIEPSITHEKSGNSRIQTNKFRAEGECKANYVIDVDGRSTRKSTMHSIEKFENVQRKRGFKKESVQTLDGEMKNENNSIGERAAKNQKPKSNRQKKSDGKKAPQMETGRGKHKGKTKKKVNMKGAKSAKKRKGSKVYDFIVTDESDTEVSSVDGMDESESCESIDLFEDSEWATDQYSTDQYCKTQSESGDFESLHMENMVNRRSNTGPKKRGRPRKNRISSDNENSVMVGSDDDENVDLPDLVLSGSSKASRTEKKCYSSHLKEIEAILPEFDCEQAVCLLKMYNGNIEMTIAAMLEDV